MLQRESHISQASHGPGVSGFPGKLCIIMHTMHNNPDETFSSLARSTPRILRRERPHLGKTQSSGRCEGSVLGGGPDHHGLLDGEVAGARGKRKFQEGGNESQRAVAR
jgi:hypothetical protein